MSDDTDQLFVDPASPVEPHAKPTVQPTSTIPADEEGVRPVVVTNRSNVLEWLSCGLLVPRAAFDKYYDDVLAVRPDVVPVTTAPLAGELLEMEGTATGNFPVLAELHSDVVQWVDEDRRFGFVDISPLAVIRALHFRDAEEVEEFTARSFDNVRHGQVPYLASPTFFSGDWRPKRAAVVAALQAAGKRTPNVEFRIADRLAGARVLGLHASATSEAHMTWFAELALGKTIKRPPRKKLRDAQDWLVLGPALILGAPEKNAGADERVFLAAAQVFLEQDRRDAWDGAAVLAAIDERLKTGAALAGENQERWAKARDRIASILRGDDAFTGFVDAQPKTEKALLLALIRDTPEGVLSWGSDASAAAPSDLTLAAVLVGLRQGRKSLSVALRGAALDEVIATKEISELRGEEHASSVRVHSGGDRDGRRLRVEVDGLEILAVAPPPPSAVELLDELDPSRPVVELGLVDLARRRGWTAALQTTVRITGTATLRPVKGGTELVMDGEPEITYAIRLADLRAAVAASDDEALREELAGLARNS